MAEVVLEIVRKTYSERSIIGSLSILWPFGEYHHERDFCVTLELPWRNNANDISCIPPGRYPAHVRTGGKKGWRLELENTSPRTNVQLHKGNTPNDIEGCILVGEKASLDYVDNSSETRNNLKGYLKSAKKPLDIYINIIDPLFPFDTRVLNRFGVDA